MNSTNDNFLTLPGRSRSWGVARAMSSTVEAAASTTTSSLYLHRAQELLQAPPPVMSDTAAPVLSGNEPESDPFPPPRADPPAACSTSASSQAQAAVYGDTTASQQPTPAPMPNQHAPFLARCQQEIADELGVDARALGATPNLGSEYASPFDTQTARRARH